MTRQQAGVSAEAVAKLVAKWREKAETGSLRDTTHALGRCANELEAALATAPPEQAEVGDNDIFVLACKLVDTAGSDRKTYWLPVLSQLCEAVRKQDAQLAAMNPPQAVSAGALSDAISYFKIEADARFGLSNWRNKPHNEKWWKRIDGTPIPNDLVVCIAEEISKQLARTLAAHDQKVRAETLEEAQEQFRKEDRNQLSAPWAINVLEHLKAKEK